MTRTDNIFIDTEFKELIPPLSTDEYSGLEKSILKEGCREPVVTWHGTIVDGHNRYDICKKHNLPFRQVEIKFEDRPEALIWIIENQFSRRNLPNYERAKLALKLEGIIAAKAKENQRGGQGGVLLSQKSAEAKNTRNELAKIAGVSHDTIMRVKKIEKYATEEIKERLSNQEMSVNEAFKEVKRTEERERIEERQERLEKEAGTVEIKKNTRLYNDDCFKILPTLENKSIDLILADLPYGLTACDWDSVLPLDKLWEQYKRVIKDNGAIILTATQPFSWKLCASNPDWFRYEVIWEKPNGTNPLLVKVRPFRVHENILVFYKKQPTYNPQMISGMPYKGFSDSTKTIGEVFSGNGEDNRGLTSRHRENVDGLRYPRSVIRCKQDRSGHPTKKPVELMSWIIKTYTNPGETVLDNTMGEGTTGVASIIEGRCFVGIEIDKKYYDVAVDAIKKVDIDE